jgi:carbon-monoxide dehydrogenase large subunit
MPLIGMPLPRREDERLTTGAGRYTADIAPRGAVHAAFVRTSYAHARILAVRRAAAQASPGVLAVLTAVDYAADGLGPIFYLPNPADALDPAIPAFVSGPGDRAASKSSSIPQWMMPGA